MLEVLVSSFHKIESFCKNKGRNIRPLFPFSAGNRTYFSYLNRTFKSEITKILGTVLIPTNPFRT